jgi:AcrR family transcriptional regulator
MVDHSQQRVMKTRRIKPRTLTLKDWFEAGLDFIKHEGHTQLSIGGISAWLGVTKGAFYYHFNDKADFESALLEHYLERTAFRLAAELSKMETPQMRLKVMLMKQVEPYCHSLCLALRAWGLENPSVAKALKKLDQFRLAHANYMFQELGFSLEEAAMRARMLVTLIQGESFIYSPLTNEERMEQLELRYKFFLRKC